MMFIFEVSKVYNLLSFRTFASAKNYASTAVNAVNTYREIYRLINSSLIAANAANESAAQITSLVSLLANSSVW